MKNKTVIIIAVIVLAIGAVWYYNNQKSKKQGLDALPVGPDAFSIADDEAYQKAKGILSSVDAEALAWVNDFAAKNYKTGKYKIGERNSKTAAFILTLGQVNPNATGKYVDKSGKPALWPQIMFDTLWSEALNPLKAEYGGI